MKSNLGEEERKKMKNEEDSENDEKMLLLHYDKHGTNFPSNIFHYFNGISYFAVSALINRVYMYIHLRFHVCLLFFSISIYLLLTCFALLFFYCLKNEKSVDINQFDKNIEYKKLRKIKQYLFGYLFIYV